VYRFLLGPRWLGFFLFVVGVAFGCVQAAQWQYHRWESRTAANALVERNIARPPVPLGELTQPGGGRNAVAESDTWRRVTATGRYDEADTVLVRNRTQDGRKGFEVLVPLVTDQGAVLVVDRGWIEAGMSALERVAVPAPPSGQVEVTGRLRASQHASPSQRRQATTKPQRSVVRIDVPQVTEDLGRPVYAGYVELTDESPAPQEAPMLLPLPDLGTGPHLAYAAQWYAFSVIAFVGWFFLVRREARDRRDAAAGATREEPVPTGV
jgi:cytochrome oxidase assembly protein ShyY1